MVDPEDLDAIMELLSQGDASVKDLLDMDKAHLMIEELRQKIEKQKNKSKKREKVIIDLKNQLKTLNDGIDEAQSSVKEAKTVDSVMEKKLEKHTKKALGK